MEDNQATAESELAFDYDLLEDPEVLLNLDPTAIVEHATNNSAKLRQLQNWGHQLVDQVNTKLLAMGTVPTTAAAREPILRSKHEEDNTSTTTNSNNTNCNNVTMIDLTQSDDSDDGDNTSEGAEARENDFSIIDDGTSAILTTEPLRKRLCCRKTVLLARAHLTRTTEAKIPQPVAKTRRSSHTMRQQVAQKTSSHTAVAYQHTPTSHDPIAITFSTSSKHQQQDQGQQQQEQRLPRKLIDGFDGSLDQSQLKHSVGKTRMVLNNATKKLGLKTPFGMGVIAKKGKDEVSHLTLNGKWNELPQSANETLEFWLGQGNMHLALALSLDPGRQEQRPEGIPIFWALEHSGGPCILYYIGHYKCIHFEQLSRHVMFKGKMRQALIEMQFCSFDQDLATAIASL